MGFGSITSFDMIATMLIQPNNQLGNPTWLYGFSFALSLLFGVFPCYLKI
jgi:hypothetical protein